MEFNIFENIHGDNIRIDPGVILILIVLFSVGINGCLDGDKDDDIDPIYRQRMRDLVIAISNYSHQQDQDFILIPQNGHELLSLDIDRIGAPAMEYINAIDGLGQEDLFYGFEGDDVKTPEEETRWLKDLLDLGEENGLEALVTDYCWTQTKIDHSYDSNEAKGYISFAADHRDLDDIPPYPTKPNNVNDKNITRLYEARNFLYLLDPFLFSSREVYLEALKNTDYDILIIDAFIEDGNILSPEEVDSLKVKKNGGDRLVISYMSIGEAEDYRYYWDENWKKGNPGFLDMENPDWEGNHKVEYWDPEWQLIIFGTDGSYTDMLIDSGFDGVYLDIIEAYEYYE